MGSAGIALLLIGYLGAGLGLLAGIGLVRSRGDALRFSGLALVSGWAATGALLSLELVAGLGVSIASVVLTWVAIGVGSLVAARRIPGGPTLAISLPPDRVRRVIVGAAALLLALAVVLLAARSIFSLGGFPGDAWNIWITKSKIVYFFHGLDLGPGGLRQAVSPDYPPLRAAVDASAFSFGGSADPLFLPIQSGIVDIAFLGALVALLAPAVSAAVAVPAAVAIAVLPKFADFVGSELADETVIVQLSLACVCCLLWLQRRDRRLLAVAALMLAALALTKDEGAMLTLSVGIALFVAAAGRRREALFAVAPAAAVFAVWRTWVAVHHLPTNYAYHLTNLFHPIYLIHQSDRIGYGTEQLLRETASVSVSFVAVPFAIAASVLVLYRRDRKLGLFALGAIVLPLIGYDLIYWCSVVEPHRFVDDNVRRVTAPVVVAAAAMLPLLLRRAWRPLDP